MDERTPENDYVSSQQRGAMRWRNEDKPFDPLNFLIKLGALMAILLLLLTALQFALVDPEIRFGLLLLALGIAALFLIGRSYGTRGRNAGIFQEEQRSPEGRNPLQSTVEELDLAFEGNPFSQMLALQELRELLVDRLVLRKHMSRAEVMDLASDPIWLGVEVEQAELRDLLTIDLKAAYAPELAGSSYQHAMITAFPNSYRRSLELLEEM